MIPPANSYNPLCDPDVFEADDKPAKPWPGYVCKPSSAPAPAPALEERNPDFYGPDGRKLTAFELVNKALAEGTHSDATPLNRCAGCGEWKVTYWIVSAGGGVGIAGRRELCLECGEKRGLSLHPKPRKPVPIGPPCPPNTVCVCGVHMAVAQCHGCAACFCPPCWWRHSHTAPGGTSTKVKVMTYLTHLENR